MRVLKYTTPTLLDILSMQNFLVVHFQNPQKIKIEDKVDVNGTEYQYKCHIKEREPNVFQSHFKYNREMVCDYDGELNVTSKDSQPHLR